MKTLSMEGACDLHIHPGPDIFDRIGNDVEIAEDARKAKMRAIVFKSSMAPSYLRAWHTARQVPGIDIYGGVVLDYHVGGINPLAVEPCIKLGGKIVWMPTYHAYGHYKAFGSIGDFGYIPQGKNRISPLPIRVTNEAGELTPEVLAIMEMCRDANIVLATSHLHISETFTLLGQARVMNFKKVLVTHPFFNVPGIDVATVGELISLGAFIEFCSGSMCPIPHSAKLSDYVDCIKRYGTKQFIISSDGGHNRKGWPAEDQRIFCQQLCYSGITEQELSPMLRENCYYLLGL